MVTQPAQKQSRPDPRGALRSVRGGFGSKGLHGYHEPEHFSPSGWLAAQKKSTVAQERDEEVRGLWKWLASRFATPGGWYSSTRVGFTPLQRCSQRLTSQIEGELLRMRGYSYGNDNQGL